MFIASSTICILFETMVLFIISLASLDEERAIPSSLPEIVLPEKMLSLEEKRHFWEGGKSLRELELDHSQEEYKEDLDFSDHYQVEFPKITKKMQL